MPEVGDQKACEHGFPDSDIIGGSKHDGFVDSEQEIQVAQLSQGDMCAEWNRQGGSRRLVRKFEVGFGEAKGIVGTQETEEGFYVKEENLVESRDDIHGSK